MTHSIVTVVPEPCSERGDVDPKLLHLTQEYLENQRIGVQVSIEATRAWEVFYSRYLPIIRDGIRWTGLKEPDVSDCIQEVWKTLIIQLSTFHHDSQRCRFRTWLQVLVRNQAIGL